MLMYQFRKLSMHAAHIYTVQFAQAFQKCELLAGIIALLLWLWTATILEGAQ